MLKSLGLNRHSLILKITALQVAGLLRLADNFYHNASIITTAGAKITKARDGTIAANMAKDGCQDKCRKH